MKSIFYKIIIFALLSVVLILPICERLAVAAETAPQPESEAQVSREKPAKTKEERLRELQLEKAQLTLRQKKAAMEGKIADYEAIKGHFELGFASARELNEAQKNYFDQKRNHMLARENLRQKMGVIK